MRYFNGQKIELLAPAGNMEILEGILETGCDAVYFGGPSLNMRMIRKGYNFTLEELKLAVEKLHKADKKAYITVNNLLYEEELEEAKGYLVYLDEIGVDGIIIQDLALLQLARELGVSYELHASVMMNVHNHLMIEKLKNYGVNRVVVSREMSLHEVSKIKKQVDIEIEYFTHGDMCIAHGAQCYYSSLLYGMSSNRGRCLKPCRWWFQHQSDEKANFPLAVKDLSLYEHLPDLIHAGVTSFKIEGRMRDKDFICKLVNLYAKALDDYLDDPRFYEVKEGAEVLNACRKRDLSTGYAFGKPGKKNINERFEGTGKFYSTGKMFSTPTAEQAASKEQITNILADNKPSNQVQKPSLHVHVNSIEQSKIAFASGADRVYLTGDIFKLQKPYRASDIHALAQWKKSEHPKAALYLGLPRMLTPDQVITYKNWLGQVGDHLDGLLAGNIAAVALGKDLGLPIQGDFSLNLSNHKACDLYQELGLEGYTASLELTRKALMDFARLQNHLEVIVYGRLPVMYFDHDFHKIYHEDDHKPLSLYNEAGSYTFIKDYLDRTHLLSQLPLNLLPLSPLLRQMGVAAYRIEGRELELAALEEIILKAKNVIAGLDDGLIPNTILGPIER